MNRKKIFSLYKKELLEFFRDRRTFLIMIFVPALLYPGLLLIMTEINAKQAQKQEEKTYTYFLKGLPAEHSISRKLREHKQLEEWQIKTHKRDADVNLIFSNDPELHLETSGEQSLVTLRYDNISNSSRYTAELLQDILKEWSQEFSQRTLKAKRLNPNILTPLDIQLEASESKETEGRFLIGRVLPGIMIIMLAVGCSFIAQEITAGERERGTLETLFCSPLSALEIVTGKYMTVATVGFFSAFINLASMSLTLSHVVGLMKNQGQDIQFSLPLSIIPIIFICFIGVSCLIAGIQLLVCTQARTLQEAGHYLIPVMLLLTLPIIISSLPTVELEGSTMWIPFLNFCLLFQEILVGNYPIDAIIAVCLSSLCLSVACFYLLVKIYNSENFICPPASGMSLRINRRSIKPKKFPKSGDAIFLFTLMLPVFYYLSTTVQSINLFYGILISFWGILVGGSLFFLWYIKANIQDSLSFRKPSIKHIFLGPLMAIIALPLVQVIARLQKLLDLSGMESKQMGELITGLINDHGLIGAWLVMAVTPAVCEEILFRGVILSGLRQRFSNAFSVFISALFFGIMHFSLFRLPLTFLLGIVMAMIVIKYRNIWMAMLFHMTFNGIQVWFVSLKGKQLDFDSTLESLISNPITALISLALLIIVLKPTKKADEDLQSLQSS